MEVLDCRSRGWWEMVDGGEAIERRGQTKRAEERGREGERERQREVSD
jgi:hypothetical protein